MDLSTGSEPTAREPIAHILIGIPGAGKSTLARRLAARCHPSTLVSSDEIRKHLYGDESVQGCPAEVFRQARTDLRAALRAGRSVIYDATNINPRFRSRTLGELRHEGARWIIGYWLRVPLEVCQQRNRARHRNVPEDVLRRMLRELERFPPRFAEGFDEIIILDQDVVVCDLDESSRPPVRSSAARWAARL